MKYGIYRVEHTVDHGSFDETTGLVPTIEGEAYVFRKPASMFIEVAYPVAHFWIMKED